MNSRDPKSRPIAIHMKPIAAAVATAVGSIPAVVLAQDAPTTMLEEIVVTATRRAESVQDIPINISAFSGGELEQQRIYNPFPDRECGFESHPGHQQNQRFQRYSTTGRWGARGLTPH